MNKKVVKFPRGARLEELKAAKKAPPVEATNAVTPRIVAAADGHLLSGVAVAVESPWTGKAVFVISETIEDVVAAVEAMGVRANSAKAARVKVFLE